MRNYLRYSKQALGLLLVACCLHLTPFPLFATPETGKIIVTLSNKRPVNPPVFEPEPNDTTVRCVTDVPPPVDLTATDEDDPSFPKTVSPEQDPDPSTIDPCTGGTIRRTWTVFDKDGNFAIVEQIITVLPDTEGPEVTLSDDLAHTSVPCGQDDFDTWLNTLRLQLSPLGGGSTDACTDVSSIDYEPKFSDSAMGPCETRNVTFILADECGNITEWAASYSTVDNEKPVFDSVPEDMQISCMEEAPDPPVLTATDNCTSELSIEFSEEISPQGSCPGINFSITRAWAATDSCGNEARVEQIIRVVDDVGPTFDLPPDITISCDQDPDDLNLTGNVTNLQDNCDDNPVITYTDQLSNEQCPNAWTIQRLWMGTDACGNTIIKTQVIEVVDDQAPSFVVPPDITVRCDQVNDTNITGMPTMVSDNCDSNPVVNIREETILQGESACPNNYEVRRIWRVEDACGNATEKTQKIFVVDNVAPTITMPVSDITIGCAQEAELQAIFDDWVADHGGARAEDNCSLTEDITWLARNAGTNTPATLPGVDCSLEGRAVRQRSVDFAAIDECGNERIVTATFTVVDEVAPEIINCTEEVTIPTDPGTCSGTYTFRIPQVRENCSTGQQSQVLKSSAPVTSTAEPGQEGEVPADPVNLAFNTASLLPLNTSDGATLLIRLENVDGEEANEFFNIIGENGTLLGSTNNTNQQCGSSQTTVPLTAEQIEAWAADGSVNIRLEPNIPAGQPGRFAVNALCDPAGMVEAELSFLQLGFSSLLFEYSIGDSERISMDPLAEATITLPQGSNLLRLFVTDCAGNVEECSYFLKVEDREAPVLSCPEDISSETSSGACTASVNLPLPSGITDNCTAGGQYLQQTPGSVAEALLTFRYDPNLNDYLAENKTLVFQGVAANAIGPATLTLDFQGDFSGTGAFITILGEDGAALGQTSIGDADCNTPGQRSFSISRDALNSWAADGMISLQIEVNDIPVPPGVPGDGINPCNPDAVDNDGDTDGESFLSATLRYDNLLPSYFAEGATNISLRQVETPAVSPVHEFAAGITTVYYLVPDAAGNVDTCSFTVTVEDKEAPVARCQPTTLFVNPAGIDIETIEAGEIDMGSTDNCSIDTMFLSPSTFNCDQVGSTMQVSLTIVDKAGNSATCSTPVRIESLGPEPTATSGVCGNDTLFLFANPPAAEGGIVFTYRWTGPNGFVSTKRDPVIPDVDSDNAGSYTVEITGITNCTATGTVEVAIEDLPLTPELLVDQAICVDEDIVLTSSVVPTGNNIIYRWYQGIPPNGLLIGTTNLPTFTIPAPHEEGSKSYYLTVEADGCVSSAAPPVTVRTTNIPQATVNDPEITVCEEEAITLGTSVSGPGLTYQWTGPNGFSSTDQFPPVIEPASLDNAGVYKLVISKNGCASEEALSIVNILPKPPQPQLSNNSPVCEGGEVVLTTDITRASVYNWIAPDLQEFTTTSNRLTIPEASQDISGPWRVYVSQFGCQSVISPPTEIQVNVNPPTQASASQDIICEGDELQLFAAPAISDAIYRWTGPNGFNAATQNPVIRNVNQSREGTYQVTITTAQGCSGTASVTVAVRKSAVITAVSNDGPECLSGPTDIQLVASVFPTDPGSYRYTWTGPGGFIARDSVAVIRNATEASNGNYQLVVTTAEGCVSEPAVTTVAVSSPPAAPSVPRISPETPAPFCEGQTIQFLTDSYAGTNVLYNWKTPRGTIATTAPALDVPAATLEDSGDYSVFVTVNGCDSQESGKINLTIGRTPVVTASSNSPVCERGLIQLRSTGIAGATYQWTGPGFSSNLPNPEISAARPSQHNGTYSLRVTLNGCTSNLVTTELRVTPSPEQPIVLNDGPVCSEEDGATLNLFLDPSSETPDAAYTWFGPSGVVLAETTAGSLELTNLSPFGDGETPFTVRATRDGCSSIVSEPTIARLNTIPASQAFAGDNFRACEGFSTELEAAVPSVGTGRWSLVGGNPEGVTIANPDMAVTAVDGLQGGAEYTFRWTLSNGACKDYSSDEVVVNVTETEIADAGKDLITCATEEITLEATPVVTNQAFWTQSDVQELLGVNIVNENSPQTLITGLEPGNLYSFTWTVVGGCGEITDEILVLVSDPDPFAGVDKVACNDDGFVQLEADEPSEGSRGRWSSPVIPVDFSDPRDPETFVMGLKPGENRFVWTIDDGICGDDSRDTVVITYKENPIARPDDVEVPFAETVAFDPLGNDFAPENSFINIIRAPESGTVEALEGGLFTYRSNANFVGTERMTYELCSEACECSISTVTFQVGEDARCEVPTIFTPNNDGVNDFFVVPCLLNTDEYPQSRVILFNRWGDEVYRSPVPYENDWRGTFNGEDVPAGTYFYIIDLGDGSPPINGYTVIQR